MKKRLAAICLVGALSLSSFAGVTNVYAQDDAVISTYETAINVPEKYTYQLTEEEQAVLEQAKLADGKEAAELLNSINNDIAFAVAVESLLDVYFEDDAHISEKYDEFKSGIGEKAAGIITDYEEALNERLLSDKFYYYTDTVLVKFDTSVDNQDIESTIQSVSGNGKIVFDPLALISEGTTEENILEVMEKTQKIAMVNLKKGQSVDKAIRLYSQMNGVKSAERISKYVTADRCLGYSGSSEYNIAVNKTVNIIYTLNRIEPTDIVWSSSDPEIVSVNQDGQITGIKEGTATVSASYAPEQPACDVITVSFTVNVQGEKETLECNSKTYKSNDRMKFNNRLISSYSQMKKVAKAYKTSKKYNAKIYKKMKTYDKNYFKKKCLVINSVSLKKGQSLKISSAESSINDNGKTTIDIITKITGKVKSSKSTEKVQCFVELPKSVAKNCDNVRFD